MKQLAYNGYLNLNSLPYNGYSGIEEEVLIAVPVAAGGFIPGIEELEENEEEQITIIKPDKEVEEIKREAEVYLKTVKKLQEIISNKNEKINNLKRPIIIRKPLITKNPFAKDNLNPFTFVIVKQPDNFTKIANFIKKHWKTILVLAIGGIVIYYVFKKEK